MYIGYLSYAVKPYVLPPLRCFKCQKYGHVAALCKGKLGCGRCAGEHGYGKCEKGAKLKCCNCGGEHSSAYRGCEAHKRAAEVQKIKVSQGISYAEAAKKIPFPSETPKKSEVGSNKIRPCGGCEKIKKDTLIVDKNDFVLFMVDVINCSAQTEKKTEKIKIIVRAAETHLGIKELGWEAIEGMLNGGWTSGVQAGVSHSPWH